MQQRVSKTVLVIDDDPEITRLLERLLREIVGHVELHWRERPTAMLFQAGDVLVSCHDSPVRGVGIACHCGRVVRHRTEEALPWPTILDAARPLTDLNVQTLGQQVAENIDMADLNTFAASMMSNKDNMTQMYSMLGSMMQQQPGGSDMFASFAQR